MPTVFESTRRRLTPACRAAAITESAWWGTLHLDRVEERVVHEREAAAAQALGEDRGEAVHAVGDRLEAVAPVVHGVHRRHHGQQHLCRADVGGGLLAADVLLAGLQREPQRGCAVGVDRDADEAARQLRARARSGRT